MKALSLVASCLILLTFVGCSPDDVPAGGNPPLKEMPSQEGLSKLLVEDPLEVQSRFDLNLEEKGQVEVARAEFESPETTYACMATMEDQLPRSGSFCRGCPTQPYRLLRYYTFKLEHGSRTVHLSELSYDKLAAVGDQSYKVNQDILAEAANTEVSMTFVQGENEDDRSVELALQPAQKVGEIMTSDRDTSTFAFGSSQIASTSELSIQLLVKTQNRVDLREKDALKLSDGEIFIESGKGATLSRETYQVQSLGALKTTVMCELID
ncbi:MAG: hypothetical protein AAF202_06025 [Pseudomonadota bacterium]